MQIYKVTILTLAGLEDEAPHYEGTRDDARSYARAAYAEAEWPRVRIELIDVDVSKDGILGLLQGRLEPKVLQTWTLSKRGGLVELPLGS